MLRSALYKTVRLLKKDFRIVIRRTNQSLRKGKFPAIIFLVAVTLFALFGLHPHDETFIKNFQETRSESLEDLSGTLGKWGDFAGFNLIGFAVIWLTGSFMQVRWLQRLAVVTFYSALLAGLSCNLLRLTTGRARPYANVEDKFYGVQGVLKGWKYHGFPSGHTSTAMGMGTPILTAAGPLGLPVFAFGSAVACSRVYGLNHYPTDVLVGGAIGMIFGVASGWHLRKIRLYHRRNRKMAVNSRKSPQKDPGLIEYFTVPPV